MAPITTFDVPSTIVVPPPMEFATYTRFVAGLTATPRGPVPTPTVATTASVAPSITATLLPKLLVT